jgi:hypothetical protein
MEIHSWAFSFDETIEEYVLKLHRIGYTIISVVPISYSNGKLQFATIFTSKQDLNKAMKQTF